MRDTNEAKTLKCVNGYDVRILQSTAGYYKGTISVDWEPHCRLSSQYAKDRESAECLSCDRQSAVENCFCNGGTRKCF